MEALNEGPGRMATAFVIRIQEPRLDRIMEAIQALDRRYPLADGGAVFVRAMEVSVDGRPRIPSDEARTRLLAAMARTVFTQRDVWGRRNERPRFSHSSGRPTFISPTQPLSAGSHDDWWNLPVAKRLPADATFYVGERDGEVMWRVMDKVIDRQNRQAGTWVELEEREKRVSVEVTLGWKELHRLGVRELADLRTFSFTKLQGSYLSFRLPTFRDTAGPPTLGTLSNRVIEGSRGRIFKDVGVLGLGAYDASRGAWLKPHRNGMRAELRRRGREPGRPRVGTGSTGTTVAWERMNKKVGMALRHLQQRERAAMARAAEEEASEPEPRTAGGARA